MFGHEAHPGMTAVPGTEINNHNCTMQLGKWVLASPDGSLETESHPVALESEVDYDMPNRQMVFAIVVEIISSPGCVLESGDLSLFLLASYISITIQE